MEFFLISFLGSIPIDPNLSISAEKGMQFELDSTSPTGNAINDILGTLMKEVEGS